jgi:hypothetical protein
MPNHDMFDLHGKPQRQYLGLINHSRRCTIKETTEFNIDGRSFLHDNCEETQAEIKFHESKKTHQH